jgi:hypothetical protein
VRAAAALRPAKAGTIRCPVNQLDQVRAADEAARWRTADRQFSRHVARARGGSVRGGRERAGRAPPLVAGPTSSDYKFGMRPVHRFGPANHVATSQAAIDRCGREGNGSRRQCWPSPRRLGPGDDQHRLPAAGNPFSSHIRPRSMAYTCGLTGPRAWDAATSAKFGVWLPQRQYLDVRTRVMHRAVLELPGTASESPAPSAVGRGIKSTLDRRGLSLLLDGRASITTSSSGSKRQFVVPGWSDLGPPD